MQGTLYDLGLRPFEKLGLADLRHELLAFAQGRVLEIGVGTGLNLPHYPADVVVTGIDPDSSMLKKAVSRGAARNMGPVTLNEGDALQLPFEDGEFDTVVATLVFCSVSDPNRGLREAARVLKPGGRFLLLEHVRKPTLVAGALQDALTPLWKQIAGGCHLNRDPEPVLRELPFEILERRMLWQGFGKLLVLKKLSAEKASSGK